MRPPAAALSNLDAAAKEPQAGPIAVCVGVARWKSAQVRTLLTPPGGRPPLFHRQAQQAVRTAKARDGAIAVWPSRAPKALEGLAHAAGVRVASLEDGFLRSNGLGAECQPPLSLVIDWSGIHFDPTRPSDLEMLLTGTMFDAALTGRAERLIEQIVTLGLTKYNLPGQSAPPPRTAARTVLVTGQVEDDLSVRLGGAGVANNLDLLRRAREQEPDAVILYKPHPDVERGHRKGAWPDAKLLRFADHVVRDVSLPALLDQVDAVHVLTSLTGFEALLRGREVVVHGQPFYAGWGLTRDLAPPPRRGRILTVAELAAAALILYPLYLDPLSGQPCSPETMIQRLSGSSGRQSALLPALRRMQGWVRRRVGEDRRRAA
jgi:capsular polysaccharide export protein